MDSFKKNLMDMLIWFHNFCEDNELKYYMVGGTMLGAIRHQGFIPWDDDVDIGMPREDYRKLEDIMGSSVYKKKYILETPNSMAADYIYPHAKLYDITTTVIQRARIDVIRGTYIDIFPIDGIGNTYEESVKNYRPIRLRLSLLGARILQIRRGRSWYLNYMMYIIRLIPDFIIKEKELISKINQLCSKRDYSQYNYIGNLLGIYGYKEIMPKHYFGTPTLYSFEGTQLYGVELYNEYLTVLYGNWKIAPPEGKRVSKHNFTAVDLNNPYPRKSI